MSATLKSRFPTIAAELRPKVGAAVKIAAELIAEEASYRAPDAPVVGEGLKFEMHVNRLGVAQYEVAAGGRGKGDAFYGHMVEMGTSHSAPRPFLIPALEAKRERAVALVRAAMVRL